MTRRPRLNPGGVPFETPILQYTETKMANKQVVFADRLVGMTVQDGLVRMDFAVNAGQVKDKDEQTKQRMEITTQLVMPFDGFVNAVAMQQRLVKELAEKQKQKRSLKAPAAGETPAA